MGFNNLISPLEIYKFPKMEVKLVPLITSRRRLKNENPMDVSTQRRELYKRVPLDPNFFMVSKMKVWTLQVSDPPTKFSRTLEIKSLGPSKVATLQGGDKFFLTPPNFYMYKVPEVARVRGDLDRGCSN